MDAVVKAVSARIACSELMAAPTGSAACHSNKGHGSARVAASKAATLHARRSCGAELQIGVPAQVFAATQKDELRKPERGMWDFFVEHGNDGVAPGKPPADFKCFRLAW